MYVTVAVFSFDFPSISIAYSKKFMDLYDNLNYSYQIDARKEDVDTAFSMIMSFINNYDEMQQDVNKSFEIAKEKLMIFEDGIAGLLREGNKKTY